MKFLNEINAECNPCKNTPAWTPHCDNPQKNPIFQRDLLRSVRAFHDAWTRNDSETRRADTGKIRGIRSLTVRVPRSIKASVLAVPGTRRARLFACVSKESFMAKNETGKTLAQLIAEFRTQHNLKRPSDRRRVTPTSRRMQSIQIARRIKR